MRDFIVRQRLRRPALAQRPKLRLGSRRPKSPVARRALVAAAGLQRAGDQNRRLGAAKCFLKLGIGRQFVGQRRAKHMARHERRIDLPEPLRA